MRILLVDADSQKNFPNLALMKLSAYHKSLGDHIELIKGVPNTPPLVEYDAGYISCVFFQNMDKVHKYYKQLSFPVTVGGSGWDHKKLSKDIEHIRPDYSLYDTDFSLGFTSRGCPNNCGFCIVPKKEGPIRDNAPITEFLHPEHNKLILLDNNFLASPKWKSNLEYLIDNKIKVNFNQGLDARILTEEHAKLLGETKLQSWKFNNRIVHFAFDDLRHKDKVLRAISLLRDVGIKGQDLVFYVLVGYDSTFAEDLERVNILIENKVDPYIMKWNQRTDDSLLNHLARWVNRRHFRKYDFFDYDSGDSKQVIAEYLAQGCPQRAFRGA